MKDLLVPTSSAVVPTNVSMAGPRHGVADAVLAWQGLRIDGVAHTLQATLPPGLSLLVDVGDCVLSALLPQLTGRARPNEGAVHCAGLDSVHDAAAYGQRVFWQNPRLSLDTAQRLEVANDWVQTQAAKWPQWDASAWQRHVQGWALESHLPKQLWQLSTGTLRKLWMAVALASGARLTVVDEPFAALDATSIRYALQALQETREALATSAVQRWVLVAHYEEIPRLTWDAVVVLPLGL